MDAADAHSLNVKGLDGSTLLIQAGCFMGNQPTPKRDTQWAPVRITLMKGKHQPPTTNNGLFTVYLLGDIGEVLLGEVVAWYLAVICCI